MKKLDLIVDETAIKAILAEQETERARYDAICKSLEVSGLDEMEAAFLGAAQWASEYLNKPKEKNNL